MNAVRVSAHNGGPLAESRVGTRVEAAYIAPEDLSIREAQLIEQAMLYAAARQMQQFQHRRRTGDQLR